MNWGMPIQVLPIEGATVNMHDVGMATIAGVEAAEIRKRLSYSSHDTCRYHRSAIKECS